MMSSKKLAIASVITATVFLIFGIILAFVILPVVIKDQIAKQVRLEYGTEQYDRWKDLPITVEFKLYLFNVVNPYEVTFEGAYPKVEEIGPYVYNQIRWKDNISYNSLDDSLTYLQYQHFEFNANASFPLTENDTFTTVNIPLNGFFQMFQEFPILIEALVKDNWEYIFPNTETMFQSFRVGDLLFDGFKFCDVPKWAMIPKLLCKLAGLQKLKFMEVQDDESIKFSFFKFKQDQHDGLYNISAGMEDVKNVGHINYWEGYKYLDVWDERMSRCNEVRGRDSTIYPPFNKPDDAFDVFSTEICSVFTAYYTNDVEVKGIQGQRRILREDSFSSSKGENHCYCSANTKDLYGENNCLADGFMDLSPCIGVPVTASFPHFLHADEEYTKTVIGLSPDIENHTTYLVVEPETGIPLEGRRRVQFNMILRPIDNLNITTNLSHSIVPILWIEEGVSLPDDLAEEFKDRFYSVLDTVEIVKWVVIALGIALLVGSLAYQMYIIKINRTRKQ